MYESFTLHFHRHKDGGTNTLSTAADLNAKRMSLDVSEIRREKYIVDNVGKEESQIDVTITFCLLINPI